MLKAIKTSLNEILYLRTLFLHENNFQIRYNARHERGWTDSYLIVSDNIQIGYGSIAGFQNHADRDVVFEFYLLPSFRNLSSPAFLKLLQASKAAFIECQSNDALLTAMLYEFGYNINSDTILLGEHTTTDIKVHNVIFRKRSDDDVIFEHKAEPIGSYVLQLNNEVIATGGFLLHYNTPFADLYMEVKESHRGKGYGSYLIQQLKEECYLSGRVPAARTCMDNIASRATLIKAGLKIVGYMLAANVK